MKFDYRKFLTENSLTPASRLANGAMMEEQPNQAEEWWNSAPEEEKSSLVAAALGGEVSPDDVEYYITLPYEQQSIEIKDYVEGYLGLGDYPDGDSKYDGYESGIGMNPDMYEGEEELETDAELDAEPEVKEVEDVHKYLSMKSAEAVLREIEQEINRSSMEQKLARLREVIAAFDNKIVTLEEADDLKGFISTSKLKEMKRMGKKLRALQEKMEKKYEKRYPAE